MAGSFQDDSSNLAGGVYPTWRTEAQEAVTTTRFTDLLFRGTCGGLCIMRREEMARTWGDKNAPVFLGGFENADGALHGRSNEFCTRRLSVRSSEDDQREKKRYLPAL